ncbi:WAT1-related protein At1g70260-like [Pistacia vera]|uniref:WAT1-related protein At1g70260-like n=1 Tax=Pistacia vera TaxID=55513 RepID=UPI0012636FB4|nr:WAT1-related protein At1g70260-like [Pistacia vera]
MLERAKMAEAFPFTVMVIMEGCTIGLTILAKSAITAGMNPFVFVVYTNALGSISLLPYSFLFHRERIEQSIFSFPLLLRIFFLGLTGIAIAQNLAFLGLSYSSPIVVCEMGLMIPTISFLLQFIMRKTKLDLGSTNIRVKVIGSLISIMGAIVVEIYKGPYIRKASSQQLQTRKPSLFVFYSTPDRWLIGGILLLASSLSICIWNIIQLGTIRQYPQVMKVVSFYSLAGTIQCAIFSLIVERDLDAWKLKLNLDLLLIIATAIFTSIIRSSVHISCTQMKGPLYVPMFKPFGIVFANAFGVGFFTNSLRYGSVIGAVITGMGYYTIMWGHVREGDELHKRHNIDRLDSSDEKVPLLEEESEV